MESTIFKMENVAIISLPFEQINSLLTAEDFIHILM